MKLNLVARNNEVIGYIFWCTGCDTPHIYYTKPGEHRSVWTFNGNHELPTFTPSLLNYAPDRRCHLFLTDGKIHYCSDCHHDLAGKTVELEDLDEKWRG